MKLLKLSVEAFCSGLSGVAPVYSIVVGMCAPCYYLCMQIDVCPTDAGLAGATRADWLDHPGGACLNYQADQASSSQ